MRGIRLTYATSAVLLAMVGAGCAHEVESPAAKANTAAPDLVCTEQLTTTVILTGDGFTPAPEQTLTDKDILVLPSIRLDRTLDLNSMAQSGSFTIPDDPKNPGGSRVSWQSEQQMSFQVFPELTLQPGLYNIVVTNPDKVHTATFEGGLAAVPAPTITAIEPDIACNDQADQTFKLTGTTLLDVGGTYPIVHVGDKGRAYCTGAVAPHRSTFPDGYCHFVSVASVPITIGVHVGAFCLNSSNTSRRHRSRTFSRHVPFRQALRSSGTV